MTLKQLHLQFCGLTSAAGPHLADLLANSKSVLDTLNLSGNKLGGLGLSALCKGLMVNTKCMNLAIADNAIDQVRELLSLIDIFPFDGYLELYCS